MRRQVGSSEVVPEYLGLHATMNLSHMKHHRCLGGKHG